MNYILLHKQNADNTRSSASQNFILFHCPLDGEQFKTSCLLYLLRNNRMLFMIWVRFLSNSE